jgi:hypothetical protein
MSLLSEQWSLARTAASGGGERMVHVILPEDPDEAHRLLVGLGRTATRTAAQINPPGVSDFDRNRLHDVISNGGFSSHPWRDSPKKGFMASYEDTEGKGFGRVHKLQDLKPEDLASHRDAMKDKLLEPGAHQGGWLDKSDGSVYLDASKHFDKEDHVRKFALKNKQKAYFNLGTFQDHYLDPHQDPLRHEDPAAHAEKYKHIYNKYGTSAPKEYESYRHLYPDSVADQAEQKSAHRHMQELDAIRRQAGMRHGTWETRPFEPWAR